jgi:hypothetical protein
VTPVLGEFLGPARDHIAAAASFRGELDYGEQRGVVLQLDRLVATLIRYLDDLPLPDALSPARAPGRRADARAAPARLALDRAARILHPTAAAAQADGNVGTAHPVVAQLAAAGDHLASGRDLLHTHFADGPAGPQTAASWWAPVITSEPVTAALLGELAGYAQTLARWIATPTMRRRLSPGAPTSALLALRAPEPWLRVAGVHIEAAQRHYYPPPARRLLDAIPSNTPPPRPPLSADEPVAELCQRLPVTAERLRHAALAFTARARWSPAATSRSWRRDALAAAITSHASELVLHTLAQRADQLGMEPLLAPVR